MSPNEEIRYMFGINMNGIRNMYHVIEVFKSDYVKVEHTYDWDEPTDEFHFIRYPRLMTRGYDMTKALIGNCLHKIIMEFKYEYPKETEGKKFRWKYDENSGRILLTLKDEKEEITLFDTDRTNKAEAYKDHAMEQVEIMKEKERMERAEIRHKFIHGEELIPF